MIIKAMRRNQQMTFFELENVNLQLKRQLQDVSIYQPSFPWGTTA
jgi:hypothetical protein